MSLNQTLIALLGESLVQHRAAIKTMTEMRRLAMIADVLGKPLKEVKGKVGTRVTENHSSLSKQPWLTEDFIVTVDGVQVYREKLSTVRHELWPAGMHAEYMAHEDRVERRKERESRR
jgi:hypothetical protein